jgi:hypothetical protein
MDTVMAEILPLLKMVADMDMAMAEIHYLHKYTAVETDMVLY